MRKIAIMTDIHALLEPTIAILEDIKKRQIKEVYSLGDNIGIGPNPKEVIRVLKENEVVSLSGNAEEYVRLGIYAFPYLRGFKKESHEWTTSQLSKEEIEIISKYPRTIELTLGKKKIGLCHFANDVRIDFLKRSNITYQSNFNIETGKSIKTQASKQFEYTNSPVQRKEIYEHATSRIIDQGYLSALRDPMFPTEENSHIGKEISSFDAIIQGHIHWKLYDENATTKFYTIRAAGMAYRSDPIDSASYIILKETDTGYTIEEVLVPFDREKMIYSITNSTYHDPRAIEYTRKLKKYCL